MQRPEYAENGKDQPGLFGFLYLPYPFNNAVEQMTNGWITQPHVLCHDLKVAAVLYKTGDKNLVVVRKTGQHGQIIHAGNRCFTSPAKQGPDLELFPTGRTGYRQFLFH